MVEISREERDVYLIPQNFVDTGTILGGTVKLRNAVEAAVLAVGSAVPLFYLPLAFNIRLMIVIAVSVPLAVFGVVGFGGDSLTQFVAHWFRFMKRRRGLVPADSEMQDIDPKGLDTAFWASVTKEDIYEYLYFLNRECGNKKSSTARRLASLHGFYDYLVNQVNRLDSDPTAAIKPPKQDKVLPKYLTAEQSMDLLESTQTQSDFPERDYCMVVLFLNCGMRLSELVGMDLDDIDLEQRQIRLFGKGHKERMVYLNDACVEALQLYLNKRNVMEGLSPKERAVFVTRRRKERISNRRVEQLVTGAMKAAGLKGFSTHKLRHTAATLMYQTGNVDILTLKQLLGHSSVGTTQIYTHLQEFQVRAAIEENPLGKASRKKPGKAALDTTEAETGESREELPGSTAEAAENSATAEDSSAPMAAFDGSAKEGFGLDTETLAANSDADTEK